MQIIVKGIHFEITDSIRNYTISKFNALERYVSNTKESPYVEIEIKKNSDHHTKGKIYVAEAHLNIRGLKKTIKSLDDDIYKAVDMLADKAKIEVSSHKDKERSLFKRGAQKIKNLLKLNKD